MDKIFINGKYIDVDSVPLSELAESLEICNLQLDSEVCIRHNLKSIKELQDIINSRECKE